MRGLECPYTPATPQEIQYMNVAALDSNSLFDVVFPAFGLGQTNPCDTMLLYDMRSNNQLKTLKKRGFGNFASQSLLKWLGGWTPGIASCFSPCRAWEPSGVETP